MAILSTLPSPHTKWTKWPKFCPLPNLWILVIRNLSIWPVNCDKSTTRKPGTNNYVELFPSLSLFPNCRAILSQTGILKSVLRERVDSSLPGHFEVISEYQSHTGDWTHEPPQSRWFTSGPLYRATVLIKYTSLQTFAFAFSLCWVLLPKAREWIR